MSKLKEIKERLSALLIKMGAVKTDKAVLMWDGDEDLKAGDSVYVEDAESKEKKVAEDGEYITEDGKTIVVKEGKVENITDPVAEVDAVDEEKKEDEEQPEENKADISKALKEATQKFEEASEAIEGMRKEINELYKIVDSILEKIGESRKEADERLSKIEKMSAAKSAKEEIEATAKIETDGDKKLERFKKLFE